MGNTKTSKPELLEYDHDEDDEMVETRYGYDYSKGILYEYEFHIWANGGNEYRKYIGERRVTTQEATDIISRGNCILFHSLKE